MNQDQVPEMEMEMEEAMFLSIIYSFHGSAMQAMGKIANPMTGEIERDLNISRGSIDALLMLQKKTKGNLTEREDKMLTGILQELQLNFLEEAKKGDDINDDDGNNDNTDTAEEDGDTTEDNEATDNTDDA